jgi:hypothetical protein
MKSFPLGVITMIASAIVGMHPTPFEPLGFYGLPGHIVLGASLFVVGVALWIRGDLKNL